MKKTIKITRFEWRLRWVLFYIVSAIDFIIRALLTVASYLVVLAIGIGIFVLIHAIPEFLTNLIIGWF
ncbi:hypothetical protein [Vagococcus fluvialis]|uniref:hypothetical protein n=1 Tax=Vagococcus fluvialis TaxID=2738 RepID=UPI001D09CB03|nr:hypothetical protein [Vagococcus fluvialis]UDM72760.1 hypothetical protein K5L00_14495 [Vagococcus fluvialis]UDM78316.1 hypothetical protein K5K98_14700 [Vagococcus fluvialis]UDM84035.1 hypothetical protein K5K96_14520 [Vagococcus fluvialis]